MLPMVKFRTSRLSAVLDTVAKISFELLLRKIGVVVTPAGQSIDGFSVQTAAKLTKQFCTGIVAFGLSEPKISCPAGVMLTFKGLLTVGLAVPVERRPKSSGKAPGKLFNET